MRIFAFIICIITTIGITSFRDKDRSSIMAEINSTFVKVNENLYFCKFETSNKDYRDFLSSLLQSNQTTKYKNNLLDTAKWAANEPTNQPWVVFYHSRSAYNNYPVVTVTYENAINYCNWLTQMYNSDQSRKFKKVIFRLPTESEWIYAATAGKDNRIYSWDGNQLRNKKGEYLANIKKINEANITFDPTVNNYKVVLTEQEKRLAILTEKKSFSPNEFGLYNMIGNAAEMIHENGRAKGGSYNDPGYDVRIQTEKKYSQASPEVGFRVVMEILEK